MRKSQDVIGNRVKVSLYLQKKTINSVCGSIYSQLVTFGSNLFIHFDQLLWYDVFDELICLWYDMLKACVRYVMLLLWLIWWDICMMCTVMSESFKMLWYDICVTWFIWYDWHAKWRVSMKYNLGVHMKDMRNDMIWRKTPAELY